MTATEKGLPGILEWLAISLLFLMFWHDKLRCLYMLHKIDARHPDCNVIDPDSTFLQQAILWKQILDILKSSWASFCRSFAGQRPLKWFQDWVQPVSKDDKCGVFIWLGHQVEIDSNVPSLSAGSFACGNLFVPYGVTPILSSQSFLTSFFHIRTLSHKFYFFPVKLHFPCVFQEKAMKIRSQNNTHDGNTIMIR